MERAQKRLLKGILAFEKQYEQDRITEKFNENRDFDLEKFDELLKMNLAAKKRMKGRSGKLIVNADSDSFELDESNLRDFVRKSALLDRKQEAKESKRDGNIASKAKPAENGGSTSSIHTSSFSEDDHQNDDLP